MERDDLVNKLFEMAGDLPIKAPDHKYVAWLSKRLDDALARAEAAERRVAELEAAQEWRPVTGDDLPDDHEEVLVVCAVPDNQVYVTAAEYTCDGHWWWLNVIWREHKSVTHWRPLPPPPTPARSE